MFVMLELNVLLNDTLRGKDRTSVMACPSVHPFRIKFLRSSPTVERFQFTNYTLLYTVLSQLYISSKSVSKTRRTRDQPVCRLTGYDTVFHEIRETLVQSNI